MSSIKPIDLLIWKKIEATGIKFRPGISTKDIPSCHLIPFVHAKGYKSLVVTSAPRTSPMGKTDVSFGSLQRLDRVLAAG